MKNFRLKIGGKKTSSRRSKELVWDCMRFDEGMVLSSRTGDVTDPRAFHDFRAGKDHAVVAERHAEPHHEKLESEASVMPGEHVFDFSLLLLEEKGLFKKKKVSSTREKW